MKNKKILIVFFILLYSSLYADNLTFSKAYKLALSNSNKILSSEFIYKSKEEDINQVKSELYPHLSSDISYGNRYSHINEMIRPNKNGERERSLNYSLTLKQSIYNPEVYSKIDLEEQRVELSKIKLQKDKQELFGKIFKSYLNIFKHQNKVSLLESKLMYYKYSNDAAKKKFKLSLVSKMDMLEADVDYNTTRIELRKEKQLLNISKKNLEQELNISDFSLPTIDYNISIKKLEQLSEIIKGEKPYLKSLDVQESLVSKKFTEEMVNNAFDAHLPKLSFDATYTKYYSHDRASDYEDTSRYMVTLRIPLYQGGQINSRVASSKLKYKAAIEDLKFAQKKTKIEFEEYKSEFEAAVESLILYKTSLKSANLYLDSIKQAYDKGLKSIIDLHEAKNKLDEIKFSYVDSLSKLIDSYGGLLKVTNNFQQIELIDDII